MGRPVEPVRPGRKGDRAVRPPARAGVPRQAGRARADVDHRARRGAPAHLSDVSAAARARGRVDGGDRDLLAVTRRGVAVLARIWGCRGSLAAPGPETVRYGGNT